MTVTTTTLTRAAGVAAAAAGAIFIGVQIGHPQLNLTTITTTDVFVRDCFKVLMCALALAGISGMYLSQVRRNGILGLVGWLVFGAGYLCIMCTTFVSTVVVPTIADTNPGFVKDYIALATSRGTVSGRGVSMVSVRCLCEQMPPRALFSASRGSVTFVGARSAP